VGVSDQSGVTVAAEIGLANEAVALGDLADDINAFVRKRRIDRPRMSGLGQVANWGSQVEPKVISRYDNETGVLFEERFEERITAVVARIEKAELSAEAKEAMGLIRDNPAPFYVDEMSRLAKALLTVASALLEGDLES
jgi:hypothetical protein